jgi:hypothetical protein
LIITFEGRDWEIDLQRVRVRQAMVIQLYTGMAIGEWEDSIMPEVEGETVKNPPQSWMQVLTALYWLMRAQNGVTEPIDDVDFEYPKFFEAFVTAMAREIRQRKAAEAAAPDPTFSPSSQPGDPPSPAPVIPIPTIPLPPVPPPGEAATAFSPPATWPG